VIWDSGKLEAVRERTTIDHILERLIPLELPAKELFDSYVRRGWVLLSPLVVRLMLKRGLKECCLKVAALEYVLVRVTKWRHPLPDRPA
jgi:hypothetical protein